MMILKNSSLHQSTDLDAFYRALRFGNIAEAYGSVLDDPRRLDRFAIIDMTGIFIRLVSTRTYHSAAVCRRIREELLLLNGMPAEQRRILETLPIHAPQHRGTVFPAVTKSGTGILLYVDTERHGKTLKPGFRKIREHGIIRDCFSYFHSILSNRYLFKSLPGIDDLSIYVLEISGLPHVYRGLKPDPEIQDSAVLALATDLIRTACIHAGIRCDRSFLQIAATGCWNGDSFSAAGRFPLKHALLKREIPECSCFLIGKDPVNPPMPDSGRVRTVTSLEGIISTLDIPIEERPKDSAYTKALAKRLSRIRRLDAAEMKVINQYHRIEKIMLNPDDDQYGRSLRNLCEALLSGFQIFMETYHLKVARRFALRLDELLISHQDTHGNNLIKTVNLFYPRYHVLLSALYRFEEASAMLHRIQLDKHDLSQRPMAACLIADGLILSGNLIRAHEYLKRYQKVLDDDIYPRYLIYSMRLKMSQKTLSPADAARQVEAFDGFATHDRPYRAYVLVRALFLSGDFKAALETTAAAEEEFSDSHYFTVWPGILWRRHGARAAEALEQFDLAGQWLTRPLPESLADRFILKVHQAASDLLHWAMVLGTYPFAVDVAD
ncbi:MAG TPA: hypothetical protein PLV45_14805, partial [bacterium]|nr:hypothetical protein [bacterium]